MKQSTPINVGVIGIGMMGLTHLDVYMNQPNAKVVAISDIIPDRLSGKARAAGNIEGQAKSQFDYSSVTKHDEGMKLIADPKVQPVDICLTTPMHVKYAIAALKAGKHVLVEKPVGRTLAEAKNLVAAAAKTKKFLMVAMCMRFWPGWTWLKTAVDKKTYGKVLSAQFRRVATLPPGEFYPQGDKNGGAILDLHIHDTDFIQYLFGKPKSVFTTGYSKFTNQLDHVVTQYQYDDIPLVVAEGGWAMVQTYPFHMQYAVNFQRATAVFDLAAKDTLTLYEPGKSSAIPLEAGMGYQHEITYFLDCIRNGKKPKTVTVADAAAGLRIIEAEVKSAKTGKIVKV